MPAITAVLRRSRKTMTIAEVPSSRSWNVDLRTKHTNTPVSGSPCILSQGSFKMMWLVGHQLKGNGCEVTRGTPHSSPGQETKHPIIPRKIYECEAQPQCETSEQRTRKSHDSDMLLVGNGPWLKRAKLIILVCMGISSYQRAGGPSEKAGEEITPSTLCGKNALY